MKFPRLTIQILGWNSAEELAAGLEILAKIPADEAVIRYIDNGSTDDSVVMARKMVPWADILELGENTGFAGGHNAGLAKCETELVMLHNPDLELDWEGTKKVLTVFNDDSVGAAQGLLYRNRDRTIIDSAGIEKTLAMNGRERGAGTKNVNKFSQTIEIFAVTGAAGIYRMSALREVVYQENEFLDKDFFAYKEDVDVGWRLNKAGWRVLFVPETQGVHARVLKGSGLLGWRPRPDLVWRRVKSRRTYYSIRNWMWMVGKNRSFREMWWREAFIDVRAGILFLLSLSYPPLMKVWWDIWVGMPKMLEKRAVKGGLAS